MDSTFLELLLCDKLTMVVGDGDATKKATMVEMAVVIVVVVMVVVLVLLLVA